MTENSTQNSQLQYWRDICMSKPGATEETPFGPEPLVYKVAGKMFALLRLTEPLSINLKCDPQEALILRATFDHVKPGYHMNKKHWNTVALKDDLDTGLILGWIDDSYELVKLGLPKRVQKSLKPLSVITE